ncbi:MAG TPA: diadenylate cyclase [Myxococcota bacterium]|jgi:uncharacterized protein (TIGR00159 family)|nr:diadenylate cyclase [Myxococcota bacterium]
MERVTEVPLPQFLFDVRIVDLLDIALVAALIYAVIVALRAARAGLAVAGMGILVATSLAARQLGMQLTAWLLQGFLAVFVVVLVVVFQSELRTVFERIAALGLRRGRARVPPDDTTAAIVRACAELARTETGALIVLQGRDPLDRHLSGGTRLEGLVSDVLLLSLFDPGAPSHDGAVVVRGETVAVFAAHLPLSADMAQLERRGTRHAAALGLAERTDALCIVVSEERGTISVAREGVLRQLAGAEELATLLRAIGPGGQAGTASPRARLRRLRWAEQGVAVGLASVLWMALVPGSQTVERTYTLPVVVDNLPEGFTLDHTEPAAVSVTLTGPRRAYLLLNPDSLEVHVDALAAAMGRRSFEIDAADVRRPEALAVENLDPGRVRLALRKANGDKTNGDKMNGDKASGERPSGERAAR